MFKPKFLKQAKLLRKGVRKFIRYKSDIINEDEMGRINEGLEQFDAAVETRDKETIKTGAKSLTKACEAAVPPASNPGLRENLEVIFVAVIIAVGIRAYCVQPFRIPTGSMQPTLNGIIAQVHDPAKGEFQRPGIISRLGQKASQGRTYVDFTIPAGSKIRSITEKTRFKFFTWTQIELDEIGAKALEPYVPMKTLIQSKSRGGFGLAEDLGLEIDRAGRVIQRRALQEDFRVQGYFDTGDQVLVDKVSYHFRNPNRGEVFVFNTRDIERIPLENPAQGSQHYIKRLCAVPKDHLEIRLHGGPLWINGEKASEEGIVRVSQEYNGYGVAVPRGGYLGINDIELPEDRYFALGDNSNDSLDSRMWGTVPEVNLVGPAWIVYWPLEHWGKIR